MSNGKQGRGGGMPNIENDINDVYGYQVEGAVTVWRGVQDDKQWADCLLALNFFRIPARFFRYSLDGGDAYEQFEAEQAKKIAEAEAKSTDEQLMGGPKLPAVMRRQREAALNVVSKAKLQTFHYPFLRKVAGKMGIETGGRQDELIDRILEAQRNGSQVPIDLESPLQKA